MTDTFNNHTPPSDVTVPLPIENTLGGANQTAKEVNNCAALHEWRYGGTDSSHGFRSGGCGSRIGVRRRKFGNQDRYNNYYANTSGILICAMQ